MVIQTHIIRVDLLQNIGLVYTKWDELAIAKEKYFETLQPCRKHSVIWFIGSEVSQSGLPEVWSTLGYVYCKQDDDHSFMKALRCIEKSVW